MYKRIFIDASIWLDYLDKSRVDHNVSKMSIDYCLEHSIDLCTSCDIITTIYYINNRFDKKSALKNIDRINRLCEVINVSNREVAVTCELMQDDSDYDDLEDTLQYILAQKEECDLILSNDKNFISKELKLMSSKAFCISVGIDNDA